MYYLSLPVADSFFRFFERNPDQHDGFATGAVKLIVPSCLDLVERHGCTAHLEFEDVDLIGQFANCVSSW